VLSGGTWLFSEPQPGTTGLVDLTTLGWTPWEPVGDGLRVAATCTVEQLLAVPAPVLGSAAELVRQCAEAFLMSFKVQSVATVGGNLCLALPAGAMISLLAALEATAVVWTPGGDERREPVATFVTGVRTTTLAPGEVLRAVEVPATSLRDRYAFRRVSLAPLGRSSAVVVARRTPESVVVTLTPATTRPVAISLPTPAGPDALRHDLAAALDLVDCWHVDAHGARDWREAMSRRLAAECLAEVAG
jgi:CO/xanthine dehydrogenase FAD-binding subunit